MEKNLTCKLLDIGGTAEQSISDEKTWILLFLGNILCLLGIQSFLFWIGNHFPSVTNLGLYLNLGLACLFWLPILATPKLKNTAFIYSSFLFAVGTAGIYLCTTLFYSWWIGLCFIPILIGIIIAKKAKLNSYIVYGITAFYLLYTSCMWIAMYLFGPTPSAPKSHAIGLICVTVCFWLLPMINKKSALAPS